MRIWGEFALGLGDGRPRILLRPERTRGRARTHSSATANGAGTGGDRLCRAAVYRPVAISQSTRIDIPGVTGVMAGACCCPARWQHLTGVIADLRTLAKRLRRQRRGLINHQRLCGCF